MGIHQRRGALLVACTLLLAGCASSRADTAGTAGAAGTSPAVAPGASMTAGMVMPDGSTMGAASSPAADTGGPSASARMICSDEVRSDIATVLKLTAKPARTSRWADHIFTCTYRLPMGTFMLSVKESADAASAKTYAAALRTRLAPTKRLDGLTDLAFATPRGTVALVKDNDTLQVDASRLPAQFGTEQQKRGDFAYEIASDILGCWTGDA